MARISPAEIQKHLAGVSYPASKEDLISAAQSEGASDDVIEALEGLSDREYNGPPDVMSELSGESHDEGEDEE